MNIKKIAQGSAAIAAASAMLAGGTTFALWNKVANVTGGTVKNGVLDLAATSGGWFDISADRTDKAAITGVDPALVQGHPIDLTTWQGVPGDTVMGMYNLDGALSGDNLVANLTVNDSTGKPIAQGTNGWTFSYSLVDATGKIVGTAKDLASFQTMAFASSNNGKNVAALPTLNGVLDNKTEYRLLVKATFDPTTAGTTYTNQNGATLSDMQIGLTQTRAAGTGGGF